MAMTSFYDSVFFPDLGLIVILSLGVLMFVSAVAPAGRQLNFGALAGIGVVTFFLALLIEYFLMRGRIALIDQPNARAVARGFIEAAIPEETLKLAAFLLWLSFQKFCQPRHALIGAVATSLAFHAVEILSHILPSDTVQPLSLVGSLLSMCFVSANGFIIGIWTAVTMSDGKRKPIVIIVAAWSVAVLAHGLWDTGIFIGQEQRGASGVLVRFHEMIFLLLASIAVQAAAIRRGVYELNRTSAPLRWPPRLVLR